MALERPLEGLDIPGDPEHADRLKRVVDRSRALEERNGRIISITGEVPAETLRSPPEAWIQVRGGYAKFAASTFEQTNVAYLSGRWSCWLRRARDTPFPVTGHTAAHRQGRPRRPGVDRRVSRAGVARGRLEVVVLSAEARGVEVSIDGDRRGFIPNEDLDGLEPQRGDHLMARVVKRLRVETPCS